MNQSAKIIKPKLGLLELAKQLGSVRSACQMMGYATIVLRSGMSQAAKPPYKRSVAPSRLRRTA